MRSTIIPGFPKLQPLMWVLKNKIKVSIGRDVCFKQSIDYSDVRPSPNVKRTSFLGVPFKLKLQKTEDPHYVLGEFYNH